MKILTCPVNGPRPLSEFSYGGELREMPDPASASDESWADYVFNRSSVPEVRLEWWCHNSSGVWFIAERDSGSDTVLRTFMYASPGRSGA